MTILLSIEQQRRTVQDIKRLKKLASRIAAMDHRIMEVFIHSDCPGNPYQTDQIQLVCHIADPEMNRDLLALDDLGRQWAMDLSEAARHIAATMGIRQNIAVTPFNFELYADGEYGDYYGTLFIKDGCEPILEWSDREWQRLNNGLLGAKEAEED
jgi:hypothetical protein